MYAVALGKFLSMVSRHFNQSEKSHDQEHVFERGAIVRMITCASPIDMKFGKWVHYMDVWKSLTFGCDAIQNV